MSSRLVIFTLLLTLFFPGIINGQQTDSIAAGPSPWPGMVAGSIAFGSALAARQAYPHSFAVTERGAGSDRGTDIIQYLPMAFPWVMKAAGAPTRSGWGRMAVSQGISAGLMIGIVKGLKDNVNSVRPDGSDHHSFPSGHSAWAFMGATMVAKELGDLSPWYTIGAYTLATGIAVERVVDHHHYPTDVVAGAGIGVLTTELGYFIGDLIFGKSQISTQTEKHLRPNNNFSYLSLETGLSLPLGSIHAGPTKIQRLPALSAAMKGAWAISDHWGLGAELGLLSTPINVDYHHDCTYVKSLSSLGFIILPYYNCTLSRYVSLTAEAGAGYRYNFPLNVLDDAVRSCSGTAVGRMAVGCVLRLSPRFSAKASVSYEMARYRFDLSPSTAFHLPEGGSASGISSSLLLSISSRYEF